MSLRPESGAGEDDQPDISADGGSLRTRTCETPGSCVSRILRAVWNARSCGAGSRCCSRCSRQMASASRTSADRTKLRNVHDWHRGSDPGQLTAAASCNHQPRWGSEGRDVFFFQNHPTISFRRVAALGGPALSSGAGSGKLRMHLTSIPRVSSSRISVSARPALLQV